MAGFRWNQWQRSPGMEGRFAVESVATFVWNEMAALLWNQWQVCRGIRSLTEAIDTTTPAGRMLMQMVGSFAEVERVMIRERTQAGLTAARARGRIGGRRPKLHASQQTEIVAMVTSGRKTQADAAQLFTVHPATGSRLLATHRQHDARPLNASGAE